MESDIRSIAPRPPIGRRCCKFVPRIGLVFNGKMILTEKRRDEAKQIGPPTGGHCRKRRDCPGQSRRKDRPFRAISQSPHCRRGFPSRMRCRGVGTRVSAIERRPDALLAVPCAPARTLRILGGALLEEVGVL